MKSILILKRSAFGDVVHTMAILPPLRAKYPGVKITWLTGVGYSRLIHAVEGVDEVIEAGLRAGGIGHFRNALKRLRGERFEALIDCQGTLKSWWLILRAKAKKKIGFHRADAKESLVTKLYSEQISKLPAGLHVIRQYLMLLKPLGIEAGEIRFPPFKADATAEEKIKDWSTASDLREPTIIINPFTAWRTKSWPRGHTSKLCRLLYKENGLKPILLWGPGEKEAAEQIALAADGSAIMAPPTTHIEMIELFRRSRLYIGGDTGPTQLAAAMGVPMVALFGPTDPLRNGPFNPQDAVIREDLDCRKCSRNKCCEGKEPECMKRITPETVQRAIQDRLASIG